MPRRGGSRIGRMINEKNHRERLAKKKNGVEIDNCYWTHAWLMDSISDAQFSYCKSCDKKYIWNDKENEWEYFE